MIVVRQPAQGLAREAVHGAMGKLTLAFRFSDEAAAPVRTLHETSASRFWCRLVVKLMEDDGENMAVAMRAATLVLRRRLAAVQRPTLRLEPEIAPEVTRPDRRLAVGARQTRSSD